MRQTSGRFLTAFRTLTGYMSFMKTMKLCPAASANAFFFASSTSPGSVPEWRTRQTSDASQKASPNLAPGTVDTMASCMSSTVLMKWDCPRMRFSWSGFSMATILMSMGASTT